MNCKWFIQEDVFKEDFASFFGALKKSNTEYFVYKHIPFSNSLSESNPFKDEDCVIAYGSLNLIKIIKRTTKWIPGYWCDLDKLKCMSYFAHFGKYLFNSDYIIIPFNELIRRKNEIYEKFGNCIFLRPDRGDKPFSGHIIRLKDFESQMKFLECLPYCSPELPIIVSSYKKIDREFRFVVSGDRVITGSLYIEKQEIMEHPVCVESGNAFNFAEQVAREKWKPDPMFVIDVCESENKVGLLEINSFSCSGFYASDKQKIVNESNKVAISQWLEVNE